MTLRKKIDQVQKAYKVLEMFVDEDKYNAYLNGLIDAYVLDGVYDSKEIKKEKI
jgi:hypothetical protein